METTMGNALLQRRIDFQLALQIARQRTRRAPLLLEDVNSEEHPRIG